MSRAVKALVGMRSLSGECGEEERASRVLDLRTLRLVPSRVSVRVMSLHAGVPCRMQWPRPVVYPSARASELEGLASYYAEPYHGRRTASGEVFDTYKVMTAAHRTLPFHTVVRVQNMANGKAVQVRINDRGPFIAGRIIDLSVRAARP